MDIPTPSPEGSRQGRVLLVVGDVVTRAVVNRVFGEDYEVDITSTIGEAVRAVEGKVYELIITDWKLEDGTGVELIQRVLASRPFISCILLATELEANASGAPPPDSRYLVLQKPLDMPLLRSWIKHGVAVSGLFRLLKKSSESNRNRRLSK